MNCLKCGKKTKDEQVFCPQCLETMEAYPVKPDVHVQLPNRRAPAAPKKSGHKRRPLTVEEQVVLLRHRVRRLSVAAVVLALMVCAAGAALLHIAVTQKDLNWGTNYTYDNPFD